MIDKIFSKIKNYHPAKPVMILYFLIPMVLAVYTNMFMNNDFYFLSSIGKYIINNGIPYYEPFSIHSGFHYVAQQWLSSIIIYFVHDVFGVVGITIFVILLFMLIIYIFYKICMLISNNRLGLSVIITTITMSILATLFIRCRPQLFDYIIFLIEFYILEKYIRNDNDKIIYILPILSILLINLHASSWFMLFIFILPYIVNSFKINFLCFDSDNYRLKPLIITMIIMFACGFINPYGLDAITYIFKSYNVESINAIVNEMHMPTLKTSNGILIYICIFLTLVVYMLGNKNKNINIKSFLLYIGTVILSICNVKGFNFFLIGGVFSLAEYMKERFPIYKDKYIYSNKFIIKYLFILLLFLAIFIFYINFNKDNIEKTAITKIVNYMNNSKVDKNSKIYCNYDDGSYLIYNGYKVYIDPRAEVYLKSNNKKEDIMNEYYMLQKGKLNFKKFLEKYDFDYLVVSNRDLLYKKYLYKDIDKEYKKIKIVEDYGYITHYLYKKVN